ncbi:MAG: type 4a pilus biogenesis protein PilO [Nannocystaceae bacterium]
MASQLDAIRKLPPARLALVWLVGTMLLGAAWYYVFYADAVEGRESAQVAVREANKKLEEIAAKERSFKDDMFAATEAEKQIEAAKLVLPLNASTVDHLMRKFQHEARLVGLSIGKWSPSGEQRLDYYAKLPVEIKATATWHQAGEFFRRVSELQQIVNVENLQMSRPKKVKAGHPMLSLKFQASTFRFLSDEERGMQKKRGGKRRRKRGNK